MSTDYAARVAKGVALLDEKRPGWERLIDLDRLELRSATHCVTAQLSGVADFTTGAKQLGLTMGDDGSYIEHGFNAPSCDGECTGGDDCHQPGGYATLNTLWRKVITGRLTAAQEGSG